MPVKAVGVNHVAFEVDDIDATLEWWSRWFAYELRGRVPGMAFIDLGDQFVALSEGRTQPPDGDRHVGLVVEDKEALPRGRACPPPPSRAPPTAATCACAIPPATSSRSSTTATSSSPRRRPPCARSGSRTCARAGARRPSSAPRGS